MWTERLTGEETEMDENKTKRWKEKIQIQTGKEKCGQK